MMHDDRDSATGCVTVVGGGPAGAAAAIVLARAGWGVRVVEQHPFPRGKVCGECVSHLGVDVIRRLGLGERFFSAGAVPLGRTRVYAQDGRSAEVTLAEPMYSLSRWALDTMLLNAAREAGAEVLCPSRCEAVRPGQADVRDLKSNRLCRLDSDFVVVADGSSSLLPPGRPGATADLGLQAHFAGVDVGEAIELFALDHHYVGLAPVEGGIHNLSFSIPAAVVRRHGSNDFDSLVARLVSGNVALGRRMRIASRVTGWRSSALARFGVRMKWPERVIPVGNAAAAIEPIGGEGIGLALRSGEMAAEAIVTARGNPGDATVAGLPRAFRKLWARRGMFCRLAARVVSNPKSAPISVGLLNAMPSLAGPALQLIGK